jgi:hypothetical protein
MASATSVERAASSCTANWSLLLLLLLLMLPARARCTKRLMRVNEKLARNAVASCGLNNLRVRSRTSNSDKGMYS